MSERNATADVSAIRNAIDKIGESLLTQGEAADNEESTKTAFILPFLRDVLGYNVENLFEVKPEYTADVGHNKGEKVDIVIRNDDSEHTPRILIECKKLGAHLTPDNASQLRRYFYALQGVARFGILTNGQYWQLYTDMDKPNVMDNEPYAVLDVLSPDPDAIVLLQDITKEGFDSGKARKDAELYHEDGGRLVRRLVGSKLSNLPTELVKGLTGEPTKYKSGATVKNKYKPLVMAALKEHFNQRGAEESDDAAAVGTGTAEPGKAEQEQPERKLQGLVNAGLLHDGDELIHTVRGQYQDVVATVRGDGGIEIEGQLYYAPSKAAEIVTGSSWNGWKFWRLRDGRTLYDLRDAMDRDAVHD